jgi:protein-L-isoaspartate(D-aspartate) O-methyltransferase
VAADASQYRFDPADAILVNAGATHPIPSWLDKLRPGGRLLLPLTGTYGFGAVRKVTRCERKFAARFIMWINIFNCEGAGNPEEEKLLRYKFTAGGATEVRFSPHGAAPSRTFLLAAR